MQNWILGIQVPSVCKGGPKVWKILVLWELLNMEVWKNVLEQWKWKMGTDF